MLDLASIRFLLPEGVELFFGSAIEIVGIKQYKNGELT
jgi:hypothetical protein